MVLHMFMANMYMCERVCLCLCVRAYSRHSSRNEHFINFNINDKRLAKLGLFITPFQQKMTRSKAIVTLTFRGNRNVAEGASSHQ